MLYQYLSRSMENARETPRVFRAFTLYCCRLQGAAAIRSLQRDPLPMPDRQRVRDLKDKLDVGPFRNALYRSVWELSQNYRWQRRSWLVSRHFGVGLDELERSYRTLGQAERNQVRSQPKPRRYNHAEMEYVLAQVKRAISGRVYKKLRFVFNNDAGTTQQDLEADLREKALRVIRRYEVEGVAPEDMVKLVARSVMNQSSNLAEFYGQKCRNPLVTVARETPYRSAWYCDVLREEVVLVNVPSAPRFRKGHYCYARFANGTTRKVYMRRLHETAKEALEALRRYRRGEPGSARPWIIDLSARSKADWMPAKASVAAPAVERKLVTAAPQENELLSRDLLQWNVGDERVRGVLDIVLNGGDPAFEAFCLEHGCDPAAADLSELGDLATHYHDVTTDEVAAALAMLPRDTWDSRIMTNLLSRELA